MVTSNAKTVEAYLSALPPEREQALRIVRNTILKNLPHGYEEVMQYGMISYVVPLKRYPVTYNKQPLAMAGLASQKNHMAVYLMSIYTDKATSEWFVKQYKASGKNWTWENPVYALKNLMICHWTLLEKPLRKPLLKNSSKPWKKCTPYAKKSFCKGNRALKFDPISFMDILLGLLFKEPHS